MAPRGALGKQNVDGLNYTLCDITDYLNGYHAKGHLFLSLLMSKMPTVVILQETDGFKSS